MSRCMLRGKLLPNPASASIMTLLMSWVRAHLLFPHLSSAFPNASGAVSFRTTSDRLLSWKDRRRSSEAMDPLAFMRFSSSRSCLHLFESLAVLVALAAVWAGSFQGYVGGSGDTVETTQGAGGGGRRAGCGGCCFALEGGTFAFVTCLAELAPMAMARGVAPPATGLAELVPQGYFGEASVLPTAAPGSALFDRTRGAAQYTLASMFSWYSTSSTICRCIGKHLSGLMTSLR